MRCPYRKAKTATPRVNSKIDLSQFFDLFIHADFEIFDGGGQRIL